MFDLQGLDKIFAGLHAAACVMCHQSTHDRHHRRSGVLMHRMVPRRGGPAVRQLFRSVRNLRLILTGVRPSGLRPNTGPNGPGTLFSPSGTDRKLLNGPESDVN